MKRQILAVLLSLTLMLSLFPTALADDETGSDSLAVRQLSLDEGTSTGKLMLYYDDHFPTDGYQVTLVSESQMITSMKTGYSATENGKDDAVITVNGDVMIATACGTCTATFTKGETSYTVDIQVQAAPISLVMITGHSLGSGEKGNGAESVICEDGQAYSTYADAGTLSTNNAAQFVPSALGHASGDDREKTQTGSATLADIAAFTENGEGTKGEGSAFAYYWNKLTGEKIWLLNAGHGGTKLPEYWLPDANKSNDFWQAVALYREAESVLSKEIAAGHYTLSHMGIINHTAANGDEGIGLDEYTKEYLSMWNGFKKELTVQIGKEYKTVDFLGIAPFWQSVNATALNDAKVINYYMGVSEDYSDIYLVTDIGRQWGTDDGVKKYFEEKYTSGTADYTIHSGEIKFPTKRGDYSGDLSASPQADAVFADISHYQQVGYNEIGKDMAHNLVSSLYSRSGAVGVTVTKRDGKAIDAAQTILMTPGETIELTLMPNPVSANNLEIVCTGNALQRISENAFVYQCIAGGTGEIQVKQGGRTLASYTVKCVSGAWYRWHFNQ